MGTQLEYLGGHPAIAKPMPVEIGDARGLLLLSARSGVFPIPSKSIVALKLERGSKRSGGKAAVGAIVGAALAGPVGLIAGAAVGGRSKDDSVAVLTVNLNGVEIDVLFGGEHAATGYAELVATVERVRGYWPKQLSEIADAVRAARTRDTTSSQKLLDLAPSSDALPVDAGRGSLHVAAAVEARTEFVSARQQLIASANRYLNAHRVAFEEAALQSVYEVNADDIDCLSADLSAQTARLELEREQLRELRGREVTEKKIEKTRRAITRTESALVTRTESLDRSATRVKHQRQVLSNEGHMYSAATRVWMYIILFSATVHLAFSRWSKRSAERRLLRLTQLTLPRLITHAADHDAAISHRAPRLR